MFVLDSSANWEKNNPTVPHNFASIVLFVRPDFICYQRCYNNQTPANEETPHIIGLSNAFQHPDQWTASKCGRMYFGLELHL